MKRSITAVAVSSIILSACGGGGTGGVRISNPFSIAQIINLREQVSLSSKYSLTDSEIILAQQIVVDIANASTDLDKLDAKIANQPDWAASAAGKNSIAATRAYYAIIQEYAEPLRALARGETIETSNYRNLATADEFDNYVGQVIQQKLDQLSQDVDIQSAPAPITVVDTVIIPSTSSTVSDSDPVTEITYQDSSTVTTNADGSTTTVVTRNYVETTTVVRTTTTVTTNTTKVTYSDGSIETTIETLPPETSTENIVSTRTWSEVIDSSTTVVLVNSHSVDNTITTVSDSDPVVASTYQDSTESVTNTDGSITTTVTRNWTDTTTIVRTTSAVTTTTVTLTYSDGSENVNVIVGDPVITTENIVTTTKRSEQLSQWTVTPPAEDSADLGSRTVGYNSDPSYYQTNEFFASDGIKVSNDTAPLKVIKADAAYSRGWTGSGSKVLVMDSGIDPNHSDFSGQIADTKSFVQVWDDTTQSVVDSPIDDAIGHGSNVASIIAAKKDGNGTHGVAYDATLMVAKLTNTRSGFNMAKVPDAMSWGAAGGAQVANISANSNYDPAWNDTIVSKGNGYYVSTHPYYGSIGYNDSKGTAPVWAAAMGPEMVLVNSAGNADSPYPLFPGIMATEEDDNGNLVLGGRLLIVGNWNTVGQVIEGAKSGHVCRTWDDSTSTCKDAYRIWDYYILAPGTNVVGAVPTAVNASGYQSMSGTSQAAPSVAGALAILHQMWPHMTGENLVKLVTTTANKSLPNYSEETHGQGLLDLDAATRPVGATGIPTSGRTDGTVTSLSGGAAGIGTLASSLSSVMVLDSFERDFYVDLRSMDQATDTRPGSLTQSLSNGNEYNTYANLVAAEYSTDVDLGHGWSLSANLNSNLDNDSNIALGYTVKDGDLTVKGQVGYTEEREKFLNNQTAGIVAVGDTARTAYAQIDLGYAITKKMELFAGAAMGATKVGSGPSGSLVSGVSTIRSQAYYGGLKMKIDDRWSGTASISRPLHITSGTIDYTVPTGRTLDGRVITSRVQSDISSKVVETDLGVSVQYRNKDHNLSVSAFGEYRKDYMNTEGKNDTVFGININYNW